MNTANTNTPAAARKTLTLPPRPRTNIFYFCWALSRRRPRQRHATREAALAEGERLTQLTGLEFVTYEARAVGRKVAP
jgi:hypothetical protein